MQVQISIVTTRRLIRCMDRTGVWTPGHQILIFLCIAMSMALCSYKDIRFSRKDFHQILKSKSPCCSTTKCEKFKESLCAIKLLCTTITHMTHTFTLTHMPTHEISYSQGQLYTEHFMGYKGCWYKLII